ncbi:MAG: hypothetical protein AMJ38_04245 [Dehalococcoidia bacterium DG_22]|nr:MAG: hypothetical protein AMJ38_04245 [Dehalococcoidia bacterium DG_22]
MQRLDKFWLIFLALAAVLVALAVACEKEEEEATPTPGGTPTAAVTGTPTAVGEVPGITDTEILLGADVPLSGAMAAVYTTIPQATETYFNYINDTQGGVCGRKIVYKVEDNLDDPARAVEVVRKLVEEDEVFAMVGSLGDAPHPAVWDYLNENEVPDILVSVGAHMFGADPDEHPWTVQMIGSNFNEGLAFGQYISENLPSKKVAVLYPNLAMGTDCLEGVKQGLDPDKNEIVSEQSFEITAVSISSQVNNLKNSGAEVVVTNATPGFSAQAIKQADRLGWHPQWFLSYVSADEMMFQFVSPELLEGAISFQGIKLATWTDDPAVAEHYRLMKEYGGPTPTNFTVYAQTVGEMAVEALSRTCDNLTREGLLDAVESLTDYHSDLFLDEVNISLSDTDHRVLEDGIMLRAVVDEDGKGRWEFFGPVWVPPHEEEME